MVLVLKRCKTNGGWGVIIDKMLNWKDHIPNIYGKLSRSIGMVMKAKTFQNRKALLTLYYSFVYPYTTYCNHVLGTACVSNLHKIIIIQNKSRESFLMPTDWHQLLHYLTILASSPSWVLMYF